jgi:hypothetical protein
LLEVELRLNREPCYMRLLLNDRVLLWHQEDERKIRIRAARSALIRDAADLASSPAVMDWMPGASPLAGLLTK